MRFWYDGQRRIEDYDLVWNVVGYRYFYGEYVDEPVVMDNLHWWGGRYWYHQDHLFNVVAMTGTRGAVAERIWYYTPYGEFISYDGNWTNAQGGGSRVANPFLYTGREYDGESGTYYYRARTYHPQLGRFLQRDPLGYVDGPGLYEYVGGRATSEQDPSGHGTSLQAWAGTAVAEGSKWATGAGAAGALANSFHRIQAEFPGVNVDALGRALANAANSELVKRAIGSGSNWTFSLVNNRPVFEWASSVHKSSTLSSRLVEALKLAEQPAHSAAHHIVAGGHKLCDGARPVLDKWKIDINSAANGVFPPTSKESLVKGVNHSSTYFNKYYEWINDKIGSADKSGKIKTVSDLVEILDSVRTELQGGKMPWL